MVRAKKFIDASEAEKCNKLLAIEELGESEKEFMDRTVFSECVKFSNGYTAIHEVCCGQNNAYVVSELLDEKGEIAVLLDPVFETIDGEYHFIHNGELFVSVLQAA